MTGTSWEGGYAALPQVATAWSIAAVGDFNRDGGADFVWQNTSTGDRSIWIMHGNEWTGFYALLPQVPPVWSIAGAGDFNADGYSDIVWQNTSTGDRSIWFMFGTRWLGDYVLLPRVATAWTIAAVADFNYDHQPDLVWQNASTGERSIWVMNRDHWDGEYALLPRVPSEWRIAAAADFNKDANPDLVWQNAVTGERSIWLMNGTNWPGNYALLPTVSTQWSIAGAIEGAASACTIGTKHTIGTTTAGTLSASDCPLGGGSYVDYYSATVSSANAYQFDQSSRSFDAYLNIFNNNRGFAADNNDAPGGTTDSRIKILLPSGDIVLAASSWTPGLGSYDLISGLTSPDIAHCEDVFIVQGVSTTQNVQSTDCVDPTGPYYSDLVAIYLEGGGALTVSMSSKAVDSYLELYDGRGALVAANDDAKPGSLDSEIIYTAGEAGYYFIRATTAFTSESGSYTLTLPLYTGPPAPASPLTANAQSLLGPIVPPTMLSTLSAQRTMAKRSGVSRINPPRRPEAVGKVKRPLAGVTGPVTVHDEPQRR